MIRPMTRDELLTALAEAQAQDQETGHITADDALIEWLRGIDAEVAEKYAACREWFWFA